MSKPQETNSVLYNHIIWLLRIFSPILKLEKVRFISEILFYKIMSSDTNFIDFLHDHYSNGTPKSTSQTLSRLQQHLEQQRKLILNEIASVKKEEEQLKSIVNSANVQQQYSDNQKKTALTPFDIEQINKLPLDL
jgi:hypothetical protein